MAELARLSLSPPSPLFFSFTRCIVRSSGSSSDKYGRATLPSLACISLSVLLCRAPPPSAPLPPLIAVVPARTVSPAPWRHRPRGRAADLFRFSPSYVSPFRRRQPPREDRVCYRPVTIGDPGADNIRPLRREDAAENAIDEPDARQCGGV